jgi:4-hydroxybenzoate polyprenyltransferase
VTRLPRLYVTMLRYRVAAMVGMFMLLGAVRAGPLELGLRYLSAAAALASSYVAATALNDLADEAIDKVNHPRDAGRPLVDGTGTRRDLQLLHAVAAALALAAAIPLGRRGVLLVVGSLAVSAVYSARPLRISHRVAGAPVLLGVAYVLVPSCLGLVAAGGHVRDAASRFSAALFFLFTARIVLKDFRDRDGDARYGKPTLLLQRGKDATCAISLSALLVGDALLTSTLPLAPAVLAQLFVAAIAAMVWRLRNTPDRHGEQVAIGIGARAGNGLLLSILGWLVLAGRGASTAEAAMFAGVLALLFLATVAVLAAEPERAVIGYKG